MSTHNQCFRAKIRKNVYPCTPQFHYIKVGCKGVYITRPCFHDVRVNGEKKKTTSLRIYDTSCKSIRYRLSKNSI